MARDRKKRNNKVAAPYALKKCSTLRQTRVVMNQSADDAVDSRTAATQKRSGKRAERESAPSPELGEVTEVSDGIVAEFPVTEEAKPKQAKPKQAEPKQAEPKQLYRNLTLKCTNKPAVNLTQMAPAPPIAGETSTTNPNAIHQEDIGQGGMDQENIDQEDIDYGDIDQEVADLTTVTYAHPTGEDRAAVLNLLSGSLFRGNQVLKVTPHNSTQKTSVDLGNSVLSTPKAKAPQNLQSERATETATTKENGLQSTTAQLPFTTDDTEFLKAQDLAQHATIVDYAKPSMADEVDPESPYLPQLPLGADKTESSMADSLDQASDEASDEALVEEDYEAQATTIDSTPAVNLPPTQVSGKLDWLSAKCTACSARGHVAEDCPKSYHYYLKPTSLEGGPVQKVSDLGIPISCYKCASNQHLGDDCPLDPNPMKGLFSADFYNHFLQTPMPAPTTGGHILTQREIQMGDSLASGAGRPNSRVVPHGTAADNYGDIQPRRVKPLPKQSRSKKLNIKLSQNQHRQQINFQPATSLSTNPSYPVQHNTYNPPTTMLGSYPVQNGTYNGPSFASQYANQPRLGSHAVEYGHANTTVPPPPPYPPPPPPPPNYGDDKREGSRRTENRQQRRAREYRENADRRESSRRDDSRRDGNRHEDYGRYSDRRDDNGRYGDRYDDRRGGDSWRPPAGR